MQTADFCFIDDFLFFLVTRAALGYINSDNRMTYHQQKRRGYGHVTVLKFCRLS